MRTSLSTILTTCGRRIGRAALLLFLAPGLSLAAAPPAELRRSETLQLERLGKVSDDERSVLRIEWRTALSSVDESRRLQEISDKLRGMEASIATVNDLVRNLTKEKRAAPPVVVATAIEPESESDWRLVAAGIAALTLVTTWWYGRRRIRNANAQAAENEDGARVEAAMRAATAAAGQAGRQVAEPVAVPSPAPTLPRNVTVKTPPAITDMEATVILSAPPEVAPGASDPAKDEQAPLVGRPTPDTASPTIDFVLEEADPGTIVEEPPVAARRVAPATPTLASDRNLEPTLHLAEIMLSMGLEQGAAQALVEYTEANPRHAVYHMLKLLGIYRKRGLHEEFMATAENLRKNFNIQAEDWGASGRREVSTLENFSRVAEHIQSIWSRPEECIPYLRRLLEDNRDGARAGFPQSVAEEILLLAEIQKNDAGQVVT
ncbi:hypothetical protein [Sulfuritalea sp.]|uniref:hypothetical protein n=1 Tax=Sulfuritalea sp. TaxID=2480090 RepID=UPI001ACA8F90|nr:hypothetical protein [Sulfuritalea sp.]MBN8473501.1 hypothetical protein [Sulfuritalea sp.]